MKHDGKQQEIFRLRDIIVEKKRKGECFDDEAEILAILTADSMVHQAKGSAWRPGFMARYDARC